MKTNIKRFIVGVSALAMVLAAGASGAAYADPPTCDGLPATLVGTNGNDTLTGTAGNDVIAGLGGNDLIEGLGGDDRICAGGGNDEVYGLLKVRDAGLAMGDNDRIFGEGGGDTLVGDFGSANVVTGGGATGNDDYIEGGEGGDTIAGACLDVTSAAASFLAAADTDTLLGGMGNDTIYGQCRTIIFTAVGGLLVEHGNTIIDGGDGADTIYGDNQTLTLTQAGTFATTGWRDNITGGEGSDTIYGDNQNGNQFLTPLLTGNNDVIDGGIGNESGDAGPGTDICTNTESVINCESTTPPAAQLLNCTGWGTVTYSPPLTNTPTLLTNTVDNRYGNQVKPSDPPGTCTGTSTIAGGSSGATVVRVRSCQEFTVPGSETGTQTINWVHADGSTSSSSFSFTRTVERVNGTTTVTQRGIVTSGDFAGQPVVMNFVAPNTAFDACATTGVSELRFQLLINIGV